MLCLYTYAGCGWFLWRTAQFVFGFYINCTGGGQVQQHAQTQSFLLQENTRCPSILPAPICVLRVTNVHVLPLPIPPCMMQATPADVALITAAAFIANVFESYLGASLQGKVEWLNNDIVNVLQISVAAALAVLGKYYL